MKRNLLITCVAGLAFILIGAGAIMFWKPGIVSSKPVPAATADAAETGPQADRTRDGMTSVRKLFSYQDRIAKGDRDAIQAQNEIVESIAEEFNAFTKSDWAEIKNVQAMMAYVLSGGRTEVVENFLAQQVATPEQEQLAKGVLSFALRRPKTAIRQIGDIDARTLDRPLVGVTALALASLHAADNSQHSIALFDDARLHAPSTAVEEAALRREVPLLLKAGEIERSSKLIARYIRIFGQSLYATRFFAQVSDGLAALDEQQALLAVATLKDALSDQPAAAQTALFLRLARTALIAGKVKLAQSASTIVTDIAGDDPAKKEKAKLYAAAALAATERAGSVLPDLQSVDDQDFDDDDKSIRVAAETVARSVIDAVNTDSAAIANDGQQQLGAQSQSPPNSVSTLVLKAGAALQEADRLIQSVQN